MSEKEILDLIKQLSEEEKKVLEEFKNLIQYYYLGYNPVIITLKV
jgi:hypothetical protein